MSASLHGKAGIAVRVVQGVVVGANQTEQSSDDRNLAEKRENAAASRPEPVEA